MGDLAAAGLAAEALVALARVAAVTMLGRMAAITLAERGAVHTGILVVLVLMVGAAVDKMVLHQQATTTAVTVATALSGMRRTGLAAVVVRSPAAI
jgi:hypothetical protein